MKTKARKGSKVLKERGYYLPTCLTDDTTGVVSLFVRYFKLVRTPKGNLRIHIKNDVLAVPEDELAARIREHHLRELPKEAEANRCYLPRPFRKKGATIA